MTVEMKLFESNSFLLAQQHGSFNNIPQLTDVAGPRVSLQCPDGVVLKSNFATAQVCREFFKHVVSKNRNVLDPLTQGGKSQRNCADTKVEVVPEFLLLDQLPQILMCGRYQTYIHLPVTNVANAAETFIFENL